MGESMHDLTPRSTDDEAALKILHDLIGDSAARPPQPRDGYKIVSSRISQAAHDGLRSVASQLGYRHAGRGNVSMLLEAIGTGTVIVRRRQ